MFQRSKRLGWFVYILLFVTLSNSVLNFMSNMAIPDIFIYSWSRIGVLLGYPLLSAFGAIGIIMYRKWGVYLLVTYILGSLAIHGKRVVAILILQPDKIFTQYYETFFTSLISVSILALYSGAWFFALRKRFQDFK